MYGFTEDKNKEFTNFCGDFLKKNRQRRIDNPSLTKEQAEGANAAKAEIKEKLSTVDITMAKRLTKKSPSAMGGSTN